MGYSRKVLDSISRKFIDAGRTIAVAESVTAGNLQAALSQAKDASRFFQGGLTAYNLGQKYRHLKVEPIHAEECKCVSAKVAEEMAVNVRHMFLSDLGVGITGFATVVPEEGVNELFAYISIANGEKIAGAWKVKATKTEAAEVQEEYVKVILDKIAALKITRNEKAKGKRKAGAKKQ